MPNALQPWYVCALVADSNPRQCAALQAYARTQTAVQLCGTASTGQRVVELLQAGLRPQVLVLDTGLQNGNFFSVLRALPAIDITYAPHVLLVAAVDNQKVREQLLTLGVDDIILNPYKIPALFESIVKYGSDVNVLPRYRLHEHVFAVLRELGVSTHSRGVEYLERALQILVLEQTQTDLSQLYMQVAEELGLSRAAVTSGIHRLAYLAYTQATPAYNQLCAAHGLPAGTHLTNGMFLHVLAENARRAMHR